MKLRSTNRRVFVSLGLIATAFMLTAAPAAAWTVYVYPPYGGSTIGYYNLLGYSGGYEVYKHNLGASATDGSIQFHLGADISAGGVEVEGFAGFSSAPFFTAPSTGSYLIDYYFHIVGGNVQVYTWPWLPPGAAIAQLQLQFAGNIYDQNGNYALQHGDQRTTVYSGLVVNPLSVYQDLTGRSGKVEFSTGTLTAGYTYRMWFYEYGWISLNWPIPGLYNLGLFDMNAKLDYATAYISNGGGGGGCILKNTPVLTPSGYVPVQKLKVGDTVSSYDLSGGQLVNSTVISLSSTKVTNILDINNGALRLTPYDQPIYMKNSTYTGWLRNPGELVAGDYLINPVSGNWTFVTQILQSSGSFTVYDVVTSGPNNYVANGFLLDIKSQ